MTMLAERPVSVPEVPVGEDEPLFEVVGGVKVYKPMSVLAQYVGSRICRKIGNHLDDQGLPDYAITETYVICFDWDPTLKRKPDVAYFRPEQFPDGLPPVGEAAVPPAWVVEVLSPNDLAETLDDKIAEYFRAGVELVWVAQPKTPKITALQPDGTAHVYAAGDTITAAPVLPKFSAKVADLFPPAS